MPFPSERIVDAYRQLVNERHPAQLAAWPVVSGHDALVGGFRGWLVFWLRHTGRLDMHSNGVGELSAALLTVDDLINQEDRTRARRALQNYFDAKAKDSIVFVRPDGTTSTCCPSFKRTCQGGYVRAN
jgi:hypothetical protein